MLEYKARITSHDNLKAELPEAIKTTITSSHEMQELLRGKDAGRYLGKATNIDTTLTSNYYPERGSSWKTAEEGDYVYLTKDIRSSWHKGTYYIVRERKSSTVWEEYNIKGHTPVFSLDNDYRLLADNQLVSQYSLKPSPEEVVNTPTFAERLSAKIEESEKIKSLEVDVRDAKQTATTSAQEVAGFGQELVRTKGLAQASYELSNDANASAADLSKRSLTAEQRDEIAYLTSSLPQLRSADGKTKLQGLSLQCYITLSSDGDSISAYLASDALAAVLKAGITNFGKPDEKENVAINHNGTGHFGNLYFAGNQIDFRIDQKTEPYLSVGAEEADFIDNFLNSARVDNTPVSISSTTLPDRNKLPDSSAYTLARTLSVANEGTRLTISIDSLKVETYKPNKAYLVLDGVVLDTWQGSNSSKIVRHPDGTVEADITQTPYTASNLIYERTVAKGTHMVQIILETPNSSDKVTLSGFKVRQRYDTGLQQSLLTKSGLRLYGSPQRYLDVDYRKQYYNTAPGAAVGWITNDYTLRVKGGAKVDKITADELDMPGVPLCGASFNENGTQIKAFGKYVNKRGSTKAQAVYDYGMAAFKVYHSIGHTNYIPIVQVSGWVSDDINWALTPRVYNITSEYFVVRILTNGDNPKQKAISYVAYKTQ
jgi:hypothetical protein